MLQIDGLLLSSIHTYYSHVYILITKSSQIDGLLLTRIHAYYSYVYVNNCSWTPCLDDVLATKSTIYLYGIVTSKYIYI